MVEWKVLITKAYCVLTEAFVFLGKTCFDVSLHSSNPLEVPLLSPIPRDLSIQNHSLDGARRFSRRFDRRRRAALGEVPRGLN